mgnify:CR=1 FL=1
MTRLFGTDGVRGLANETLTASLALKLGAAAATVLTKDRKAEKRRPLALIGRDPRVSGEMLAAAMAAGMALAVQGCASSPNRMPPAGGYAGPAYAAQPGYAPAPYAAAPAPYAAPAPAPYPTAPYPAAAPFPAAPVVANLPVATTGITGVTGSFVDGDPVDVVGPDGTVVARGLVNYTSGELPHLMGRSTKELAAEIGPQYEREVIHRDHLAIL